ncbi:MAG: hypothetical protein ING66_11145, partial [Rhodocyclaceae bacterium]|nr:hypothetical protein [Rhodocyclaceae bacterium]
LNTEIDKLESRLDAAIAATDEWKLVNTVPGIGKTLARVILMEKNNLTLTPDVGPLMFGLRRKYTY